MPLETTIRGWVAGRVQGVGYRASFKREAVAMGLQGWVRNLPDGRVEFLLHGSSDSVAALLIWARRGPQAAHVVQLHTEETDERPDAAFDIRY